MPELPEVERAADFVKKHAQGKRIIKVHAFDDPIVFSGTTASEFACAIRSRIVKDVRRYGKVFFLILDGDGPLPVLHFGMTGNVLIKGEEYLYYREGPKKSDTTWPPRFLKFILHLSEPNANSPSKSTTEIAFVDARRLGRIRLCPEPMKQPPISLLGFDPILCMPDLEDFSKNVLRRNCPIKPLLLDQSFSAGVGNWVADEILYHSRIHPEQKCSSLTSDQILALHRNTTYVCKTAVSVNADSSKFPDDWLFNHRWGKGKKKQSSALLLPSGEPATIRWLKVGGRTSAFVVELQKLAVSANIERNEKPTLRAPDSPMNDSREHMARLDEESSLTSLSDAEETTRPIASKLGKTPKGRKSKRRKIEPAQ